jgi:SAM-dependent methyltransferase
LDFVFHHPDAAKPCDLVSGSLDDRPLALAFQQFILSPSDDGVPPKNSDHLVPPPEMLFDGAVTAEQFKLNGEGFTQTYLIERARLPRNGRVLDLGSGNGQKARVLAYYLDDTGSYEGLDVVQSAIEWCQGRYSKFKNFRFQVADVYSSHYNLVGKYADDEYCLPFPNADFDLVFLCSVFTHMLPSGVGNYISEVSRVLKPGGRCVSTYFLLNEDSRARIKAGTSSLGFESEHGPALLLDSDNPSRAVAYDEGWVRERLASAGLRVAEATYGTWCGGKDMLASYQDALISVKE